MCTLRRCRWQSPLRVNVAVQRSQAKLLVSVDEEAAALVFERFPAAKLLLSGSSALSPSSCGTVETTSCVERRRVVLLVLVGPGSPALTL